MGTYVLEKAGSTRCGGIWTENHRIWSENAPFWLLSERFGRGSVSDRSAAADAVRAFVVPFNSVSAVPARPAMGFRVLPAVRPPRPSGGVGLRPSWSASGRRSARRVPPESPASQSQEKTKAHIVKNLPVKMETLVGLSSSYALHTEGVPSGPVCGYGPRRQTRDARQRSGTPIRARRRETGKARRDPPGFARITFPWLKMNHSPGAGQAGRRRPRAPRVDQQTAKQDGPSRSRDRPTLTRYGGCTRKGRRRRLRRVLSPETIIAETPCICKEFLLQSECLQYAKQGGRHE